MVIGDISNNTDEIKRLPFYTTLLIFYTKNYNELQDTIKNSAKNVIYHIGIIND